MSPDDLYASNNTTITPNNIMEHLNQAIQDIELINVSGTGQNDHYKAPVVTDTPPVIEMTSEAVNQNSVRQSNFLEHNTEYSSAIEQDSNVPLAASKYMTDPKTGNYEYVLRGTRSQISYTVYGGMNDYLKSRPRYITYRGDQAQPTDKDFIMRDLDNDEQKYLLDPLVEKIQDITPNKDDQARIAISLVQNIDYDIDSLRSGEIKGKYPYEVLYTGCGVCSEKSKLLAYLLRGLGYEVAIFRFIEEKHDAIGIKGPQEYSYRDTGYCFVESTSPSIVTDSSGDYVVGNSTTKLTTMPDVLTICEGNSFDSTSEEYNDAVTWNTIGTGKVLDEDAYNIWLSLVNKYGIKTTS
jgi:hypothetical protein